MHCSLSQRNIIAKILQEQFGENLLILNQKTINFVFSPKQLKGKVLIKTNSNYPTIFKKKFRIKPLKYINDPLTMITSVFKEDFDLKKNL